MSVSPSYRVYRLLGLTTLAAAMGLAGCSQIIKTGANVALRFGEKYVVPPILATGDTNQACESSNALAPTLQAAQAMGADAAKLMVLLDSGAALCAEERALTEELAYLRYSKAGQVEAAQDARIAQKRWAEVAARRQYKAYQAFTERYETKYRFKMGDRCPNMKTDFEKTTYLLGLMSGLQAITNDTAAQGAVDVPKDIAAVVERGMKCLDNEQFWGTPMAVRAAIWTLLPGASEGKPDPWQTMKESARIGEAKGIRLPHAIYAVAAQASGKPELIRDALQTYGKTVAANMPVNPKYRLFDAMGSHITRGIGDRYWMENTGTRMPDGGYTTFWDSKPADDTAGISIDDL